MAGSARPFSIPVGLAFAVCMTGFSIDSARAESGDGTGLVMGGAAAPATSHGPNPGDAFARALDLPLSRGPVAHVPLPRERAAGNEEPAQTALAETPVMAGLRVAVPLPRERPIGEGAELAVAEAEPANAPAPRAFVPLPPERPIVVAALESAGEPSPMPALRTSLPLFASGAAAERGGGIRSLIARHASANGIPTSLADAVVSVESRYNPHARNGANIGLMQISLPTARSLGYGGPAAGLADAETNLTYGVRYLAQAYRLADGDTCRTILKYQGGHRAVTMTTAARSYCDKVRMHAANLR
jgi:soluble lytic murein transglycosylase-like protein